MEFGYCDLEFIIMATLTETAYYTRRAINWTILGIILYFCLRILWFILVAIYMWLFPPKPPPPNHAFGVLPKLSFPQTATPSVELKFKLETIEGRVPEASATGTVYFMPKQAANLLALTRTQNFAKKLGFETEPTQEKKNIYIFKDNTLPLRSMRFDIVSGNFSIRYLWEMDTSIFEEKFLFTDRQARDNSLAFLKSNNLLTTDLVGGYQLTSYLRMVNNQLVPAISYAQADVIRTDLFRADVNSMKIYHAKPKESNLFFAYSGANTDKKKLLLLQYTYWPIDPNTTGTYELKTSEDAWNELIKGGGYIASYPSQGSTVVVRRVTLGYYDSLEPQTYLQPIFVFEGDYDFTAYVQAVSPEWIEP